LCGFNKNAGGERVKQGIKSDDNGDDDGSLPEGRFIGFYATCGSHE